MKNVKYVMEFKPKTGDKTEKEEGDKTKPLLWTKAN